jgi:hypothetical protein
MSCPARSSQWSGKASMTSRQSWASRGLSPDGGSGRPALGKSGLNSTMDFAVADLRGMASNLARPDALGSPWIARTYYLWG